MDVYKITDRVTGKCYVGSTIRTAERRFREHCTNAVRGERVSPLYDAMRERGTSNFAIETLATASLYEELLALERAAISAHDCVIPNGYNVVKGGRGNFGWKMSQATRQKIAAKAKGRIAHNKGISPSDETRAKQSLVHRERHARAKALGIVRVAWNRGVPHSQATREKMSQSHAGYTWSAAHRAACAGKTCPPKARERISDSKRQWWASLSPSDRASHIDKMTAKAKARALVMPSSALHKGMPGQAILPFE